VIKPPPYNSSATPNPTQSAAVHQHEESFDSIFHSYLHILTKRRVVIFVSMVLFIATAFVINSRQTPVYESSAEIVFEPKTNSDTGQDAMNASFTRDPTFFMTQSRILRSDKFASRVVEALDREDQLSFIKSLGAAVSHKREGSFVLTNDEAERLSSVVKRSIDLRQVATGARILQLAVSAYSPQVCSALANTAADVYVLMNHESRIELYQKRVAMTNKSLVEIREKIKTNELALDKVNNEIKLLSVLKDFGELYPEVVSLKDKVNVSGRQLGELQKNLEQSEIGQRQRMLSLIVKPHTDLASLEAVQTDLSNLKGLLEQEIETNREIYDSVFKNVQEMELTGGGSVWVDIKVIEPAGVPSSPIRPNKKLNLLIGLLVGILAGVGLAFFLEYLDSSIRSIDDVKAYLKLSSLGIVPEVEFDSEEMDVMKTQARNDGGTRIMWNTQDLKIPLYVAEAYRIIRTNFVFGAVDKSLKVFQVTSAVKGEGKTTTTVNLGISLAQVGLRILLVDADLRRPSLHKTLRLGSNERGLSQILQNQMSLDEVIRATPIPNLQAITSGGIPEHPSELLSSPLMNNFIIKARELFDVVLIDSPPVISVADAPVIASHVDGTLLVVRAGYIPRRLTLQAKKSVEAVNGKVLGVILNGVSSAHHPYYYYRYYTDNYYTYYGEENAKGKKGARKKKKSPLNREVVSNAEKLKLSLLPFLPESLRNRLVEQDLNNTRDSAKESKAPSSKLTV